jgi:hypothetical protein
MTTTSGKTATQAIERSEGLLRLKPAWVARDWLPPGRRLGLSEDEYDVGERGYICERWLASTTHADNRIRPPDEGLSYLNWEGPEVTLGELVQQFPEWIMGETYASTHDGLGRLAKIFDFGARIPYHIHPRSEHARLVGRNSKDEAYYFPPEVDMGGHPETFLGVHPYLGGADRRDTLLPYLVNWNDDRILQHAPAYLQLPEEGFFVPSGVLHAPGTALTIELQEDSDTLAMFQALNAGQIISKDLLFKDVPPEYRARYGESFLLEWVDWPTNADPYFYENHHLKPVPIAGSSQSGGEEHWLFLGSRKFSGKKLTVHGGQSYTSLDSGAYSLLVWQGTGDVGDVPVKGRRPGDDELLVAYHRATQPLEIHNSGTEDLIIIKFFGPDVNNDAPPITSVL